MLPVVAMCGHLCGFDMTATTAIPEAVRTGFARNLKHKGFAFTALLHIAHGRTASNGWLEQDSGPDLTTRCDERLEITL